MSSSPSFPSNQRLNKDSGSGRAVRASEEGWWQIEDRSSFQSLVKEIFTCSGHIFFQIF
jgi:hypothetical protein